MKLGIAAGISRWGDDRYKTLKKCGFDYYDYNMPNTKTPIYTATEDEMHVMMREERRLADEAGVKIWQVHGPWEGAHTDLTPEGRAERMEKMQRSIRATATLGAPYWVIHPIFPFDCNDLKCGKAEETFEINVKFMSELLKTAKDNGITICYENMPFLNFSISKPDDILRVVKEINDDNFKICLDTGHANIFPDWSPARVMREMGEHVRVLHVHDNRWQQDMHLAPFHGTIDWLEFGASLKEIGFDGVLSLETSPSCKVPSPLFEDMFPIYARLARAIMGEI